MPFDFHNALPHIRNEYAEAKFDPASGLDAEALLHTLDTFMEANRALPLPLRFSGALKVLAENCQLAINPHTPFGGKINHGVVYRPDNASGGVLERVLSRQYEQGMAAAAPQAWQARKNGFACGGTCPDYDVWHICPDWERLLKLGFAGMKEELLEQREGQALTEKQQVFYASALEAVDAALILMRRLEAAAREKGAPEYADALAHLRENPPETFYQVLVLTRFYLNLQETGKERARTYGAVDLLWKPYVDADLAAGRLTQDEADDLIRFFLEQTAAEMRFADQPLCLGSVCPDGTPGPPAFALRILKLYDELDIHNPKLHIRCPKNMDRDFLRQALDMIRRGHSSLVLLWDETVYAGYERIGVGREIAQRYLPTGCYEPVIPGVEDARICSAWINLSKPVEMALTGGGNILADTPVIGKAAATHLPRWEDFEAAYFEQLKHLLDYTCDVLDDLTAAQEAGYAAPLLSATIASCVRDGKDVFQNGMEMRNLSLKCMAIGTAVDSLLAVKQLVYEDRDTDIGGLVDILRKNWQGHEDLRQKVLKSRRKWGNHQPEADRMAKAIYDCCWDQIKDRPTQNGGRYRIGCDSVAQANYGYRVGATPDGRLANTLLSKNMRPTTGMEREGLTALIQSVCSLDCSRFVDAAPLDFWLHPTAVKGEEGMLAFEGLVNAFFRLGGFALHGNVLNAQQLIEAQREPEKHPNLQIRVCGWNEYFVRLSKELQDDFIARSLGIEACEAEAEA